MIFLITCMSFVLFYVMTWICPNQWASFGFMILTLMGCIGGLVFDSFLTPYIFREKRNEW